ncbi:hypothetical protein EBR77_01245, partial [bacterium]|nr:hypothetical protein [bacterium]
MNKYLLFLAIAISFSAINSARSVRGRNRIEREAIERAQDSIVGFDVHMRDVGLEDLADDVSASMKALMCGFNNGANALGLMREAVRIVGNDPIANEYVVKGLDKAMIRQLEAERRARMALEERRDKKALSDATTAAGDPKALADAKRVADA